MNQIFSYKEVEIAHVSAVEIKEIEPGTNMSDEVLERYAGRYRVIITDINQVDVKYLIDEITGKIMLFDSYLHILNHYGKQGWQVVCLDRHSSSTDFINNYIKVLLCKSAVCI